MKITYTDDFYDTVKDATLVVDTCVIVDAHKNPIFNDFLEDLATNRQALLVSIPEVKQEFLTVADSRAEYQDLTEYIEALDMLFLPEKAESEDVSKIRDFNIAIRRSKSSKSPSYVDRKLFSIPYLYSHSAEKILLMTSNHRDIPFEFFDRAAFIARDNGKDFSEVGIYKFNDEHFQKITGKM